MEFGSANNSLNSSGLGLATPGRKGSKGLTFAQRNKMRRMGDTLDGEDAYPCSLQLYSTPPTMDVSLEQFEDWAVQRLRVLRTIEKHNLGGKSKFSDDWVAAIYSDLEKNKLLSFLELDHTQYSKLQDSTRVKKEDYMRNRMVDHVSHFILRLAYCRTEELRRSFITLETDLFRLRWSGGRDVASFMESNAIRYESITEEEKKDVKEKLYPASGSSSEGAFYRVPWLEAVDLVKSRRCLLVDGFAYIPETDLQSLVVGQFRGRLARDLAKTCRVLPVLEEDQRLVNLVTNLDKRYTGEDYGSKGSAERIVPAQIPELSQRNFPLCMKSMQEVLETTHHVKYKSRLQYGLFLKGIGLSLEDAMKFWRGEFTKSANCDVDKFEKEYSYGIRYNYGKEGKKKNWQPYDCMKIIMENVGPGESHGCPFRHHESRSLRQRVEAYGLKKEEADEVLKKVESGHFQIACGLHYNYVHLKELSTGATNHPNQWYLESRGLVGQGGKDGGVAGGRGNKHLPTTKATVYGQSQSTQDSQAESFESMDDSELCSVMDAGVPCNTQDISEL